MRVSDILIFYVFAAGIAGLLIRGSLSLSRGRRRAAFSAWLTAFVWAVFWHDYNRVSVDSDVADSYRTAQTMQADLARSRTAARLAERAEKRHTMPFSRRNPHP